MKDILAALAALYPDRSEVWETSDGLLRLTLVEAEAQAKHLPSAKIKTYPLTRPHKRGK